MKILPLFNIPVIILITKKASFLKPDQRSMAHESGSRRSKAKMKGKNDAKIIHHKKFT
jgi:hypothetical protein